MTGSRNVLSQLEQRVENSTPDSVKAHHVPETYLQLTEDPEWVNRACVGDERYLADTLTKHEKTAMQEICYSCPIWALCEEYAARSNPRAGFWAGIRYPVKRTCDPRTTP